MVELYNTFNSKVIFWVSTSARSQRWVKASPYKSLQTKVLSQVCTPAKQNRTTADSRRGYKVRGCKITIGLRGSPKASYRNGVSDLGLKDSYSVSGWLL